MMDLAALRAYLLAKPGTAAGYPFGPEAQVFKVLDKMFALIAVDEDPHHLTLKCDPDEALFLRDLYPSVRPGYHMNKRHWNTIVLDGNVPEPELRQMVDDSYSLVVKGLTKAQQAELAAH